MIKIEDLSFGYKEQPVFEGINCQLETGKIVSLLGQNGEGKTTLFKLLTGFLRPSSGKCSVNNFNIHTDAESVFEDLYFVPDTVELPNLKIRQYAELYGKFYPHFSMKDFKQNLHLFNIEEEQDCQKISYGQQKKVALAFAIATNCNTILFDESINGLDIKSKKIFRQLLISNFNKNKLYIISTHQIRDIENLFDHIIIINNKKIILNEKTESLKFNPLYQENDSIENLYLKIIA